MKRKCILILCMSALMIYGLTACGEKTLEDVIVGI